MPSSYGRSIAATVFVLALAVSAFVHAATTTPTAAQILLQSLSSSPPSVPYATNVASTSPSASQGSSPASVPIGVSLPNLLPLSASLMPQESIVPGASTAATSASATTTASSNLLQTLEGEVASLESELATLRSAASTSTPTSVVHFTRLLTLGSKGSDVTALQTLLAQQGLFATSPSGFYGPVTQAAVAAFQSKNGLDPVGSVGPKTRALLNELLLSSPSSGSSSAAPSNTQSSATSSQTTLPIGVTLNYPGYGGGSASSGGGNTSSFTIAPVISPDLLVQATSASGVIVNYPTPTATDEVDGTVPVSCNPASGSLFAIGTTTVSCLATDTAGNTTTSTFVIIVWESNTSTGGILDGTMITGINIGNSLATGLLWDGVDQATDVAQLVSGHYFAPTYDITTAAGGGYAPTLLPSTESTPIGSAIRWPGSSINNTNTGYGALGWLQDNFTGAQVYDSIKSATDLSNIAHPDTVGASATEDSKTAFAAPPPGWTVATVYRQEGYPGEYTAAPGGVIFGRVANAFETAPYAFWTFHAHGGDGDTSVEFSWNNNGTQSTITWSSPPPLGSMVALVARATTIVGSSTTDTSGVETITDLNGDVWSLHGTGQYGAQIYKNGSDSSSVAWILVLDADGRAWAVWGDSSAGEPPPYHWYGLTAGTSGSTPRFKAQVALYGGIVGETPTLIGSVPDQTIVGYDGNNESQIGWGSFFHMDTGYVENVFDGNVFRGAFWGRPLTNQEITDYVSDPDVYHTSD
jgi:peptidoglycan hydrolase-like protein with peptidoglycan-binding domain